MGKFITIITIITIIGGCTSSKESVDTGDLPNELLRFNIEYSSDTLPVKRIERLISEEYSKDTLHLTYLYNNYKSSWISPILEIREEWLKVGVRSSQEEKKGEFFDKGVLELNFFILNPEKKMVRVFSVEHDDPFK